MSDAPEKAYKNLSFLNSPPARTVRILCEYEEPRQRFRKHEVHDTIVFFGSARARPADEAHAAAEEARRQAQARPEDAELAAQLKRAQAGVGLSTYYEASRELARRLTAWSMERDGHRNYTICTGGGPGIMEAANRGAADVPRARSVGLGISLPFEQGCNAYVSPDLAFDFHYFFMRKLWFVYLAKACVFFPGGFGTLDEMFEVLTLVQTGKVRKQVPMVLFGTSFWDKVIDLQAMVDLGTCSPHDPGLAHRTDSVDEAFDYLTAELMRVEREAPDPSRDWIRPT